MIRRMTYTISLLLTVLASLSAFATLSTTQRQAVSTAAQDIETVVISQMRTGVEHQVSVWMELSADGLTTQLKFAHHASGTTTTGTIPALSGFTGSYADPYLAQNAGIGRIYLVGLARAGGTADPSRILLWRSLNGGLTWSAPVIVDQDAGGNFLDKPTLSVSPTTGYIYVAYKRNTQIKLKVSLNNGGGFDPGDGLNTFFIGTALSGNSVPMVVNDDTGEVYVMWVRYAIAPIINLVRGSEYDPFAPSNRIQFGTIMSRTLSGFRFYNAAGAVTTGSVTVRSATVPMVKIDTSANRIVLTWHGYTSTTTKPDIYMMVIPVTHFTDVPVTSWGALTVIATSAGPALQPALDFDPSNGNFLVSYYGFRASSSQYDHSAVYVSISGTTPSVLESGALRATPSDVSVYPADSVSGHRLLGEYQDVHFANGSFKTASIVITTQGDPYVFTTVRY